MCPPLEEIYNSKSSQGRLFLSLSQSQCGFSESQPLVCCTEVASAAEASSALSPTALSPKEPQSRVAPTSNSSDFLKAPACGIYAEDRFGDRDYTKIDEYPWLALLQYSKR